MKFGIDNYRPASFFSPVSTNCQFDLGLDKKHLKPEYL
jgi:hypothetical protein